nr:MAG TPA: head closure knob [Caudoviricetes sp.]
MSLIDESMTKCVLYDKVRKPDGEGGYITTWSESVEFDAAITFDSSMQARIGEKAGVTSLYTVTLPRGFEMSYHDVFKRISDGKIFRVTSDGDDKITPARATFQFSQVTAEEWALTT